MLKNLKQFSLPEVEEKALGFWRKNDVFRHSLRLADQRRPKHGITRKVTRKKFVFYEGPPTANGRPGIHHVLARAFKDIVLRYKTMRGFFVPRRGGWDTHGLPVEIGVEKALGLKSKKEIEKYGVAAFNKKCKESVWQYKEEWERLTERIGFWLDLKNPYITYENSYIESVWGILKKVWEKGLIYKGHKVVPWCTRCGTALSSHELALGYKEVEDNSVYVKFKVKAKTKEWQNTSILSWTTTPWTLPGNVALAVGEKIEYVKIKHTLSRFEEISVENGAKTDHLIIGPGTYILAKDIFWKDINSNRGSGSIFGISGLLNVSNADITQDLVRYSQDEFFKKYNIEIIKGKDLIGLEYEPLFKIPQLKSKTSYKIYPADFVTTTEGTGVVHTAVMYGEDDYNLGKKVGLPQFHTVGEDGKFIKEVPEIGGFYTKDKKTEEKIINYLTSHHSLLKTELHKHDYPFCWRCGTPLLYYARDSWFIAMSKLRNKLLAENKKINWIPESIKDGRFGEWLKEVKDWAISRERYWGTPLPFWQCEHCGAFEVVENRDVMHARIGGARNTYILMRHGESENNAKNIINGNPKNKNLYHLTVKGKIAAEKAGKELKKQKIDLIFASYFKRTAETAKIIGDIVGVKPVPDARLREINTSIFEGTNPKEYHNYFANYAEKFSKRLPEGETLRDVAKRMRGFMENTEKKYRGKNILIVSHEYPLWMLETVMRGWSEEETIHIKENDDGDFIRTGEFRKTEFLKVPRNEYGFGDLHKPYVDAVYFACGKCGKKMRRTPEVLDVWFDSGAMPFAQQNTEYSIQNTGKSMKLSNYPADYITEGIDQTRGWFYTLLAIGVLMGKGTPYKNVISLGLTLDKNGQKMSKSKGNVVDPWVMIQKYGSDVVRWYFYTVNPPGEPKKFDEADLGKVLRQFVMMLYNCFVFYNTYADRRRLDADLRRNSLNNVLDQWILNKLNKTLQNVQVSLDKYNINHAARFIKDFVEDLSKWYIRRSRRRFQKPSSLKDYKEASATLNYVLVTLSKMLAPFMPFFAEALYKSLDQKRSDSVHLCDWPRYYSSNDKIRKNLRWMEEIRNIASVALAKRAAAGIKVRQPLLSLTLGIKFFHLKPLNEFLDILKDEVNVKEIIFDKKLNEEIELDTNITHELKEEGWLREFVRMAQNLRQDAGLEPKDRIVLMVEAPAELNYVFNKFEAVLKKEIGAKIIEYKHSEKFTAEIKTKLDGWDVWVGVRKI